MVNYNNIDYLLNLEISRFYELILYRHKQIIEDKIYNRWLISGYDKEISLDEFKQKLTGTKKEKNKETNKNNNISYKDKARFNRLDVT